MAPSQTRSARLVPPLVAAALALAVGAVAEVVAAGGGIWTARTIAANVVVGVATIGAGVVAWVGRPDSRVGPLMVAIGGVWFLGDFAYGTDQALVDLVGFPLQGWHDVLLVVLLLTVTAGERQDPVARLVIGAMVGAHVALGLARLLLRPPLDVSACLCVPNRITGIVEPESFEIAGRAASAIEAALAVAALVVLARRWQAATEPTRSTLRALVVAGIATTALVTYNRLATRVVGEPRPTGQDMILLLAVVRVGVPLAVTASLIRGRRARARVADVLLGLERGGGERAMRRALGDPSVLLLRWDTERALHVDDRGRPVDLPESPDAATVTAIERDGSRLGALVHDRALREEPELLDAVVAAARLALHNERLAVEARQRLDEVRASRQRLVTAVDEERRRLERDLHDGAQQRLVALALQLRALERRAAGAGDIALADDLDDLARGLDAALAGIRELARGIRPPLLVEGGLEPALAALALTAPVPTEIDVRLPCRLPDAVEATLYFIASEGLANALRHADASRVCMSVSIAGDRLALTVSDDGAGGADPRNGSGLVGLADRVGAIGGTLEITSEPGAGTTLAAFVPQPAPVARR